MNPIIHFEIHAADQDKIQHFYESLFGWRVTVTGPEFSGYRMIATADNQPMQQAAKGINGGITPRQGALPAQGEPVNAFVNIVGVENTDAMVTKAQSLGGTVAAAAMEVPQVGRLAYLKDPEGNLFGVLQPAMGM